MHVADGNGLHRRGVRRQVEGTAVFRALSRRRITVGGIINLGTGARGGQADAVARPRDGGSCYGGVSPHRRRGRRGGGVRCRGRHRQRGAEVRRSLRAVRHRGAAARGRRARQIAAGVAAQRPGERHRRVRHLAAAEALDTVVQRAVIVVVGVAATRQRHMGGDGIGRLGGRRRRSEGLVLVLVELRHRGAHRGCRQCGDRRCTRSHGRPCQRDGGGVVASEASLGHRHAHHNIARGVARKGHQAIGRNLCVGIACGDGPCDRGVAPVADTSGSCRR